MATVIEEFLIGLGFSVAQDQLRTFNNAITGGIAGFSTLASAAEDAAAAIAVAVAKISDDLDKLYFQSQRTKASAEDLTAFAYAARQTGTSADAAAGSIENLAGHLRRMPGLDTMLKSLGVTANDPVKMVEQLHARLQNLPLSLQLHYSDMLGIDEKTYLNIGQQGAFMREQQEVAGELGLDLDKAAKAANGLWTQLRSVGMVIESIFQKVVQEVSGPLSQQFAQMRKLILDNAVAIERAIIVVINFISSAMLLFIRLGTSAVAFFRIFSDWMDRIPQQSKLVLEGFLAIAAVLLVIRGRLFGIALLNPFTYILAGLAALLLLMDDYVHYKKFGKEHSYFNWGGIEDFAKNMQNAFANAGDYVKAHWQWLIDLLTGHPLQALIDLMGNRGTPAGPDQRADSGSLIDRSYRAVEQFLRATGVSGREDYPGHPVGSNNALTGSRAASVSAALSQAGFSQANIAGFLGNLDAESGFDPRAGVLAGHVPGTGHVGIAQWDANRQAEFLALYGKRIEDSSVAEQSQFIVYELQHKYKSVADALHDPRATTNDYASTAVVQNGYEIPATDPEGIARELRNRAPRGHYWAGRPEVEGRLGGGPPPALPYARDPTTSREEVVPYGTTPPEGAPEQPLPNPSAPQPAPPALTPLAPPPVVNDPNAHIANRIVNPPADTPAHAPPIEFRNGTHGDTRRPGHPGMEGDVQPYRFTQTNTYNIKATDPVGTGREIREIHRAQNLIRNTKGALT